MTKKTTKSSKSTKVLTLAFSDFKTVKQFIKKYNIPFWTRTKPKKIPGKKVQMSKINKLDFPRTCIKANDEGMKIVNRLIEILDPAKRNRLSRTPSGGISQVIPKLGFSVDVKKNGIEILFMDYVGKDTIGFRLSFDSSTSAVNETGITGRGSYFKMKAEFAKDGINLDDYAVTNGEEIKKEIKKPRIELSMFTEPDKTYQHVNHIDLHSAYPSGVIKAYPELTKTISRIYANRKISEDDRQLKIQLDASIGYFQSEYCVINHKKYALANLAKAGVNWCHDTVTEIAKQLSKQNKRVLAFNTDGIWYVDKQNDFKSKYIGDGLGKAAIDHVDCTIRFKSAGAYEYIENGVYTPVKRGTPKEMMTQWGDIYKYSVKKYGWDPKNFKIVRCVCDF